jgi:hypothetical protein
VAKRCIDRAKTMISQTRGDFVSLSEAAKWFLESAQDDRVEAAELLSHPTETLVAIQRKWDQTRKLSRAEWVILSFYIQAGCEEPTEDPKLPRADSFAGVLEAFLDVRSLRREPESDLDSYYLGNLQPDFPRGAKSSPPLFRISIAAKSRTLLSRFGPRATNRPISQTWPACCPAMPAYRRVVKAVKPATAF